MEDFLLFDLEAIGPLDLPPLEVNEVEYGGVRLRFNEPVQLKPRLNEDNPQFVNVEEPSLGLDAFAGMVSGLMDEVADDLVVVWQQYALAPDAELSLKALELKRRLLAAVERCRLPVTKRADHINTAIRTKTKVPPEFSRTFPALENIANPLHISNITAKSTGETPRIFQLRA